MARLLETYKKEISARLKSEFGLKNIHQVPVLKKIVINMGVKEGAQDIKILEQLQIELGNITGQKPVITRAKKAISNFKLRQGNPIGLKVTLRGKIMYEFMDRLVNIAMPRIKDFRGVNPKSFDDGGNYTMGLTEQIIFPEVEFDRIKKTQGMDVTFVFSQKNKEINAKLLEYLGMPFRKK